MEATTETTAAHTHARSPEPASSAPRFASIGTWTALSGLSRNATYRALTEGHLKAVKVGKSTKIDVAAGLQWMDSLPAAVFRAPPAGKATKKPAEA